MYLPLGPCYVCFNDVNLGVTLKEEDTSLEIKVKTEDIKTDESLEIKEIIELCKEITFKTTLSLSEETLNNLRIDRTFSSLTKEGELRIITLDNSAVIFMYKVKLIAEPFFAFKGNKTNKIKVKAVALSNGDKKDIEILFGTNISILIKNNNLILYAPSHETMPKLMIKNKRLIHRQITGESDFKIVNGHLIEVSN